MAGAKMTRVTIEEFVRGLEGLAGSGFQGGVVSDYVSTHPIAPESLQPYLFFSSANYTRNLVFKNDIFEVIAICWGVGQVSRIHNHRDQQCWMAVPIGKLENQNYRVAARNPRAQTCRLEPASTFLISPDAPLAVDPEEPVHQVRNRTEYGQRAVSIHIYSRPFNTCEVYSLEQGKYYDVELQYTSEYGKLCPGEKAALASL